MRRSLPSSLAAAACCSLVLTVPGRALAGGESLAAGISAYERLRYNDAIALLQKAAAASSAPAAEIAQARLYLGIVFFSTGDRSRAADEFREAIRQDPSLKLPTTVSPKIAAYFQSIASVPANIRASPAPPAPPPPPGSPGVPPEIPLVALPPECRAPPVRSWNTVSLAAGGGGAAALAVAGVLAFLTYDWRNDARTVMWADQTQHLNHRADRAALGAAVLSVTGAVALATAACLYFWSPSGLSDRSD